jgi:hypothetical protein
LNKPSARAAFFYLAHPVPFRVSRVRATECFPPPWCVYYGNNSHASFGTPRFWSKRTLSLLLFPAKKTLPYVNVM